MVLWWLHNIAGEYPGEVANLLRSLWGDDPERAKRLLNWFAFVKRKKTDIDLFQLCDDIINSHPHDLFQEQGRDLIKMIVNTWMKEPFQYVGQILHSVFEAWFALNPGRTPFDREMLKAVDNYFLRNIAKKSPQAVLDGTTDALCRSINMVIAEGDGGTRWDRFNFRTYSESRFGFDEFLDIYRTCLKKVAKRSTAKADIYLEKLDPHKHPCLMHVHLEIISANPDSYGKRLISFITNKMVFKAGWQGADWMSFAHACKASMPYLSSKEREHIEKTILNHNPETNSAAYVIKEINRTSEIEPFLTRKSVIRYLNRSKYEQWCILETIGESHFSPIARKRMHELRRKFHASKIEKPDNMEAHIVESPIKQERCNKMKDNHWLAAIKRYDNNEERHYDRRFITGGARDLAFQLKEATQKNPEQFSDLSLKIPDHANKLYIGNILQGLADADNPSDRSLIQAVKRAHQNPEKIFGHDIVQLLEKKSEIADDPEMLEILLWYVLYGEANEREASKEQNEEQETISINTLIHRSETSHTRGISNVRGKAWEALGSVLWKVPKADSRAWDAIKIAVKNEPLISVRCCIMNTLMPLFNRNKELFSASIRGLIVLPDNTSHQYETQRLSPLTTRSGVRLFPYMFYWLPELAEELSTELIKSDDKTQELIGTWLIFCESFRNNAYIDKADALASLSVDHRRLFADVAGKAISWAENKHHVNELLKTFFSDEDSEVRKKAANAFRHVESTEVEFYRKLSADFLKSPAFMDNSDAVLDMLENASCDVLGLVIDATQRIVDNIIKNPDQQFRYSAPLHQLQNLLKREYISSESNPEARRKILDLIDLMLFHEISGVEGIIADHDRW